MYRRFGSRAAALACGLVPLGALAQTAPAAPPATAPAPAQAQPAVLVQPAVSAPVATPPACADCITIPKLTPVRLELLAEMGSKISKTGQTFAIKLADPIMIDGKVIVPAGVTGQGEVIFAKGSGGSGAPGELVLAARYFDVGDRRLKLRSMQFAVAGASKYKTVERIEQAAIVTAPVLGVAGLFIKGKDIAFPAGTVAEAKTAEDIAFSPAEITTLAAMPSTQGAAPPVVAAGSQAMPAAASAPAARPISQPASQEKGK